MLSLIVPFYNSAIYLASMLNSIISQPFSDYEILLIDDGSSDVSLEIAESFAKRENRIKVFHQNNRGVSCARNTGVENASGDLICFLDADDVLMPNALSRMIKGMENTMIDLFIGGYIVKNSDEQVVYSVPGIDAEVLSREQGIEQMYHPHPYRYQGYIWNKMFRRSIIEQNHLRFDEAVFFNEDRLFVTQYIAAQTGKIFFDPVPVYSYYERRFGAMASLGNKFNPKFATDFDAIIKMYKTVHRTFHSIELNKMALEGVMNSYSRIHNMMESFGCVDKKIHKIMQRELMFSLPPFFLLKRKFNK